jgi:hypothetical protein
MSVYLGCFGGIELMRDRTVAPLQTALDPSDVSVSKRRFAVDFNYSTLITGDRIEIATVDGSDLELVSGHNFPDGSWFVSIDEAGGIRLYSNFQDSLSGAQDDALELIAPSSSQEITIQTINDGFRFLGRVNRFELTTSRDTIDLTSLGTEFRKQFEQGLISGQGNLDCEWEANIDTGANTQFQEFSSYLARLLIRVQQGADFTGRFFIHRPASSSAASVWYEAKCIVTNVAVSVAATEIVTTKIDFVTSDQIVLKQGVIPSYLLQENSSYLLQEDGSRIAL